MARREVTVAVPKRKTDDEARERGRQDRLAGKARTDCPYTNYPFRNAPKAWLEGFDEAGQAPTITTHEPPVKIQDPEMATRGEFWPKDKALPDSYTKPRPVPCPSCRRTTLPTTSQAVIVRVIAHSVAYLMCRGCGHRFKLPISAS
jgi:ribosome modulation factor